LGAVSHVGKHGFWKVRRDKKPIDRGLNGSVRRGDSLAKVPLQQISSVKYMEYAVIFGEVWSGFPGMPSRAAPLAGFISTLSQPHMWRSSHPFEAFQILVIFHSTNSIWLPWIHKDSGQLWDVLT
jgi:hypothetical protein